MSKELLPGDSVRVTIKGSKYWQDEPCTVLHRYGIHGYRVSSDKTGRTRTAAHGQIKFLSRPPESDLDDYICVSGPASFGDKARMHSSLLYKGSGPFEGTYTNKGTPFNSWVKASDKATLYKRADDIMRPDLRRDTTLKVLKFMGEEFPATSSDAYLHALIYNSIKGDADLPGPIESRGLE